jgi:protocatechuate 3,4-dioxygenase beta subunit
MANGKLSRASYRLMRMPTTKPPSPARWLLTVGGIGIAAALVWLVASLFRPTAPPNTPDAGAPAATTHARKAHRPRAIKSRKPAGIEGHVVDAARAPVAGASVCVWAAHVIGVTTTAMHAPRCTETDAKGSYSLENLLSAAPLVVSAGGKGSPPQRYRGPDGDVVRLGEGERRAGIDFVLRGGGVAIEGRVNDATGGVVAGALVATEVAEGVGRAVAKSDEKGTFTLWVEPGPVTLRATAEGYAPGVARGLAPGHFFAIHLLPGSTLVGRAVVAGTDTPVPDALIDAIQVEGGPLRASTRTDDEGRFKIDALQPGRYRIEATAESLEGYSGSSIILGMGETSKPVLVELDPAYVVRGRVVDKASGEPCKGGKVTITDDGQNEFSQAIIDEDGWSRMASVIPGTYKVRVECKGHIPRDDYPVIAIKDRDAPEQTWEVDGGARVRVVVVDGAGKPVESAEVSANPRDSGPGAIAEHAEPDGAFLLAGLKKGVHDVRVRSTEGSYASKEVNLDTRQDERIRIELPSVGVIDGVVEDDAKRPVANALITAIGPATMSARSTEDGRFSLLGLLSGEYEVSVDDPSGGADTTRPPPRKIVVRAPGRETAHFTVRGRDGELEGRVIDRNGQPITDAFIDFVRAEGAYGGVPRYQGSSHAPIVTDTEGHFKIEGLAAGEYNLRAYRKGGGEASADHVKVGTRDVALRLAAGASIAGTLTSARGPVERFQLNVRNTTTGFYRYDLFFHSQGTFAIQDLPAGAYEITAYTPAGMGRMEVTVAEGEEKTGVSMTLLLRGAVEGRVVGANGLPVEGARVSLHGESNLPIVLGRGGRLVTDHDGRFHLEGVLSGAWTLTAVSTAPDGDGTASVPVQVSGVGTTDVGAVRLDAR